MFTNIYQNNSEFAKQKNPRLSLGIFDIELIVFSYGSSSISGAASSAPISFATI